MECKFCKNKENLIMMQEINCEFIKQNIDLSEEKKEQNINNQKLIIDISNELSIIERKTKILNLFGYCCLFLGFITWAFISFIVNNYDYTKDDIYPAIFVIIGIICLVFVDCVETKFSPYDKTLYKQVNHFQHFIQNGVDFEYPVKIIYKNNDNIYLSYVEINSKIIKEVNISDFGIQSVERYYGDSLKIQAFISNEKVFIFRLLIPEKMI